MRCVKIKIEKDFNNIERYMNKLLKEKNQEGLRLREIKGDTMCFTRKKVGEEGRQIVVQGSSKHYGSLKEFIERKEASMEDGRHYRWTKLGEVSFEKRNKTIFIVFLERFTRLL